MGLRVRGEDVGCTVAVVPANAGTHTPRPIRRVTRSVAFVTTNTCGYGSPRAAFAEASAGPTSQPRRSLGVDGSRGRHGICRRPCERRDPYAAAMRSEAVGVDCGGDAGQLWLWVPAFAGTTWGESRLDSCPLLIRLHIIGGVRKFIRKSRLVRPRQT